MINDPLSNFQHPMAGVMPRPIPLTAEQFVGLRDLLAGYSGVYLDDARQRMLENGLGHRMTAAGLALEDYARLIHSPEGRDELRQLSELVVNHETFFFRNKPHMRALREVLLPELHRRKPDGVPLRIWSAGCATGEEPYSLAIIAQEVFGQLPTRPIEIWGTDISMPALARARTGYYQGRALANVSDEMLVRYFQPHGKGYIVNDAVKELVRFEPLNLLEPFPAAAQGVDMIFCQNVMIYFRLDTCRSLLERFYRCLPDGGLLFLGFSETLWNVFDGFRSREVAGAFVYYKGAQPQAAQAARPAAQRTELRGAPQGSTSQSRPAPRRPARADQPVPQERPARLRPAPLKQEHVVSAALTDDERLLRSGRELLEAGQIDAAMEALRHISPRSPSAAQAMVLVARIHADRGELDLALAEIQRVSEIDPLIEEAYVLLGVIYGRQGEWQAAVRQFERARYLNQSAPLISYHLAEAYRQSGRRDLAVREYRNTLYKLDAHPPDTVLDGVAIVWLRETCQRHIGALSQPT